VLTPPDGLTEHDLADVLHRHWGIHARELRYAAVGWGSHHWVLTALDGTARFVTVDELDAGRDSAAEPRDEVLARLASAVGAARALADTGSKLVVAPAPGEEGSLIAPVTDRFAAAVYPLVEGDGFSWGHPMSAEHRAALLDMVVEVHAAPADVRDRAPVDDYALQHRDALEAALGEGADSAEGAAGSTGPYAARVARLVADHATALRAALTTYDDLVDRARRRTEAAVVLTHGEPHPGNTMRTADGWRLIDWDTARVPPPERDLWSMDPGDGSVHEEYVAATGRELSPMLLELYRRRWDLSDVAVDVARFRRPHRGDDEDAKAFGILRGQVGAVADA
jgi:hypothetical protein